MKFLGVISFIFGLGLLIFAGYGMNEEFKYFTAIGMLAIILLVIAGLSSILFVINTFSRTKIYGNVNTNDDILDLPDHIVEDEKAHGVSPFVIGCGIVSMIAGALVLLYSIYAGYTFVWLWSFMDQGYFRIEFLIVGSFFLGSILHLVYVIRKLFFSRK